MASETILKQKEEEVKALAEKFKEAKIILLTDYRGINVSDDTKLRKDIREANGSARVLKNNIIKRKRTEIFRPLFFVFKAFAEALFLHLSALPQAHNSGC